MGKNHLNVSVIYMNSCSKCNTNTRAKQSSWCRSCINEKERKLWARPPKNRVCKCGEVYIGRRYQCKDCFNLYKRLRYAQGLDSKQAPILVKAFRIKREYGLTLSDLDSLRESQGGRCSICLTIMVTPSPGKGQKDTCEAIDHCHSTGRIRGLLCNKCNKALGGFRDDACLLQRAEEYLSSSYLIRKAG